VSPFPAQPEQDARLGDEFIDRVSHYLSTHLDPDQVDATRTFLMRSSKSFSKMGVFGMKIPKEYGGLGFSQVNITVQ